MRKSWILNLYECTMRVSVMRVSFSSFCVFYGERIRSLPLAMCYVIKERREVLLNTDWIKIAWNALRDEFRELQLELLPKPFPGIGSAVLTLCTSRGGCITGVYGESGIKPEFCGCFQLWFISSSTFPSSDLSEFVLYWRDGQCVCMLATAESFAVENSC